MIDELYRGELNPCKADYRRDPNYSNAMDDIVSAEEAWINQLGEADGESLRLLTDAYARLGGAMTERAFHDGFCLVLELIFDVLNARN